MKLIDLETDKVVHLPNDLLWVDEMNWAPVVAVTTYTLSGALVVDEATMKAGRPITLEQPDESMAWVKRGVVSKLLDWSSTSGRRMKLVLDYPDDRRGFTVMFRHESGGVEASPVKGFPQHDPDDWFNVTIRLIEVE